MPLARDDASANPFVCPECGIRTFVDTLCPRCNKALIDERTLPAWKGREEVRSIDAMRSIVIGGALGLVLALAALVVAVLLAPPHVDTAGRHSDVLGTVLGLGLYAPLLGALFGSALGLWYARRRGLRAATAADRAALRAVPLVTARDAPDGARVHLRGRVRARTMAFDYNAEPCVAAVHATTTADGRVELHNTGGEFELDDGSGVPVLVRAEHVAVAAGLACGDRMIVPPDAEVELVGTARWVAPDGSEPQGAPLGLRDAARAVEITGTSEAPIVVRMLGPDAAEVTALGGGATRARGVRAVEPASAPVRVDARTSLGEDSTAAAPRELADEVEVAAAPGRGHRSG